MFLRKAGGSVILDQVRSASGLLSFLLLFAPALVADNLLIIPFFNSGKYREIDWIGDSISERLFEVAAAAALPAVDREERDEMLRQMAIRRYAVLTKASVAEIGVNLDANLVVYGDFQWEPASGTDNASPRGTIRIQANVLDIRGVKRGPAIAVSGPIEELSRLESDLAWQLIRALGASDGATREEFFLKHPPIRLDALENYVRGLLAASLEQKLQLFAQAARLEPGYSQPCYQMGALLYQRRDYRQAAEWLQRVTEADASYRPAQFYLGISLYHLGDYAGAQQRFAKVAATAPIAEVLNNLGAAALRAGDAAAVDHLRNALEANPSDPDTHFNLGYALWKRGAWEEAAQSFRATLQRRPEDQDATLLLGRCLSKSGPRPGDVRTEGLERLNRKYNEKAWFALRAVLGNKKD
jgi:tetratricopeptide (TPR) repeat protein